MGGPYPPRWKWVSENCHEGSATSAATPHQSPPYLRMTSPWRRISWLVCCGLLAAAAARAGETTLDRPKAYERAAQLAVLGKKLFADPSLSASGRMACATCHDPDRAFGP